MDLNDLVLLQNHSVFFSFPFLAQNMSFHTVETDFFFIFLTNPTHTLLNFTSSVFPSIVTRFVYTYQYQYQVELL